MESNASNAQEANRLYWQTDRSVGDIAEVLGVSRRALYELVQPEGSGTTCNECGGDVVFTNRSARTSGLGRCQQCGTQSELTELPVDVQETVPPYVAGWPRVQPAEQRNELAARAARIGGVALAGAALGAVATLLITRQR